MSEFSNALILTTPHIKGKRVSDAQYLMQGHSVFGPGLACYKDQPQDGDFGPIAAQAAARTKFWLGYPQPKCTPTFGQPLYNLLVGKAKITSSMEKLRQSRLNAATPGLNAFLEGQQFTGYKESPPGSNDTIFGRWYGFNGEPWCAMFLSYCFAHSSWSKFHYAAVEAIYYDMLAGRNSLRRVWSPQRGDVMLYSFGGETFAHTAFYDQKIDDNSFYDFGGNTGPSNFSNGGEVLRQVRSMSIVHAICRVG